MPNYFMTAKNPEEARDFFADMVEQGKLKIVLAQERPDIYSKIRPSEDVHLVIDAADATPPEGVEFDRVLGEFRPTPLPEDQVASWSVKEPEPPAAEEAAAEEEVVEVGAVPAQSEAQAEAAVEDAPTLAKMGILDQPWKPFTSRGYKG